MTSIDVNCKWFWQAVQREAFIYMDGQKEFVQIDHKDLYPYLLVNIGSGVSMIKVNHVFRNYLLLLLLQSTTIILNYSHHTKLFPFVICRWMGMENLSELVGQVSVEAPFGGWENF